MNDKTKPQPAAEPKKEQPKKPPTLAELTATVDSLRAVVQNLQQMKITIPPGARVGDTIVVDEKGQIVWTRAITHGDVVGEAVKQASREAKNLPRIFSGPEITDIARAAARAELNLREKK